MRTPSSSSSSSSCLRVALRRCASLFGVGRKKGKEKREEALVLSVLCTVDASSYLNVMEAEIGWGLG